MTCPDVEGLLDGSALTDDHVESCHRCKTTLAALVALREGLVTYPVTESAVDRVMESIREEKEAESRRTLLGAASTFLLVLATSVPVLAVASTTLGTVDASIVRRAAVVAIGLAAAITFVEPRWLRG